MSSNEPNPVPLGEIAKRLNARLLGNPSLLISGIAAIHDAGSGEITFVANPKYSKALLTTKATAVLLREEKKGIRPAQLLVGDPYYAFSRVVLLFHPGQRPVPGVHPHAVIGKGVRLGESVSIGPFVTLEQGVVIGDRAVLHHGVYIGERSTIGAESMLYPNVTIRESVTIGKRVIVHGGTVVGSDGFGFATHEGRHHKIPQVGEVVVEDDVEIGANVTIDRAALGVTRIGRGTKIDNLVQVAHNVVIGEDCLIVAQVGISGSTELGHHVVLGGQVGVVGHVKLGDHVMGGAQAGIIQDIPDKAAVWGTPAIPHREELKAQAIFPQLPKMRKEIKRLSSQVSELTRQISLKNKNSPKK